MLVEGQDTEVYIMLKAVIIDDEVLSIDLTEYMLRQMGGVQVVARCVNPEDGLAAVATLNPDIVFLDIQMPAKTGMDVARELAHSHADVDIVFITAYDRFALEAFQVRAVDYILKPIDQERLKTTVDIIKARHLKSELAASNDPDAEPALQAQFLGTFLLFDNGGNPIKWRTKKVKELCAYLLHHRQPVYREQIIEDLWPNYDANRALHYLHMSIYHIRKTLKDTGYSDTVRFVNDCYSLNVNVVSDITLLRQALESASDSPEHIESVVNGYSGDYLDREDYLWALRFRQELHNKCKLKLEYYLNNCEKENGRHSPLAQACLEKLMELDPLREEYAIKHIQRLVDDNRKNEAVQAYRQYAERLWDELKEKPGEAVVGLATRLGLPHG